jgi:Cu-Zn family superoxide dismutase
MHAARTARLLTTAAIAVGALALLPSTIAGGSTPADAVDGNTARAVVRDVNNAALGVVTIQANRDGSLAVTGRLSGLAAGFHGFHIHAVGVCNPTATDASGNVVPFTTAGGHLNPAATTHGQHAGDLPMLLVKRNGTTRAAVESDAVTLADIFDADGGAFIVHAAPDNAAHIPTRYISTTTNLPGPDAATLATGDAGGRVACGVITRS